MLNVLIVTIASIMLRKNMLFLSALVLVVKYKKILTNKDPKTINEIIAHVFKVNKLLNLFHHDLRKSSGTGSILSLINVLAISILCCVSSLFGSSFSDFS